jgi:hypothetical protein
MSDTETACPSCGTPLQRATAATGLRYQCSACQGVIITLAVFRRVVVEGAGSQLWVRSANELANGHPCGFCTRAMRPTPMPGDTGKVATVEVCRGCESVWVPAIRSPCFRCPHRPLGHRRRQFVPRAARNAAHRSRSPPTDVAPIANVWSSRSATWCSSTTRSAPAPAMPATIQVCLELQPAWPWDSCSAVDRSGPRAHRADRNRLHPAPALADGRPFHP